MNEWVAEFCSPSSDGWQHWSNPIPLQLALEAARDRLDVLSKTSAAKTGREPITYRVYNTRTQQMIIVGTS